MATNGSKRNDDLSAEMQPDRPFYATGMLLAEDDFRAEQLYHRGRLARVLVYLHGSGTVAGLRVRYDPAVPPAGDNPGSDEMVTVEPRLAIDRLGRLIEISSERCIRLSKWYNGQPADTLELARHTGVPLRLENGTDGLDDATADGVVVDVFVSFYACERGKTPAFVQGPFDAIDAVQANRLRDSSEIKLVPRTNLTLPKNLWPDLESIVEADRRQRALHSAIFGAYPKDDASDLNNPEPPGEHELGEDTTAVFLARLVIPAAAPVSANERPARLNDPVVVDNHSRLFAYTSRAIAARTGL